MVKRLTLKDQITRDEYLQRIHQYTDEDATKHGYPSAEVLRLEVKLGEIAGAWRKTKDDKYVYEYASILYKMILNGYDVEGLPIQDQLPDELMPELPPQPVQAAIKRVYQAE